MIVMTIAELNNLMGGDNTDWTEDSMAKAVRYALWLIGEYDNPDYYLNSRGLEK